MHPSRAAVAAATHAALTASHLLADHIVQTDAQAIAKGGSGRAGRTACAAHCLTYTGTQAAALLAADLLLDLRLRPRSIAVALAVSGATHYAIDRSGGHWAEDEPTTRLVRAMHRIGKAGWLRRDPQAGYRCDQTLHHAVLAVAAVIAAR